MAHEDQNSTPLWRKILKWTFRSIGYTLLVVFLVVVVVYFYVFRSSFLEKTIKEQFAATSNGTIDLKVKKASLFRGFEFQDIIIYSGEDFNRAPLFKLERLTLKYNIPGIWVGDLGVHEVGIYRPEVYLVQKGDVWNVDTLMKPSEGEKEKKEEEEEKAKESGSTPKEIRLPFKVRLFFKFVLEDFKLVVDGSKGTQPLEAGIQNFTFRTHLITKKTSVIPLTVPGLVNSLHTLLVQLNPQETIDIYFRSADAQTHTPFDLHFLVGVDGEQESPGFTSRLKVGQSKIPVRLQGKQLLPLDIDIGYNMYYDPHKDKFSIEEFRFSVLDQLWMHIVGGVENATDPEKMKADIELDRSNIDLTALYPHYRNLTGDTSMRFGGNISLAPMKIKGEGKKVNIDGSLSMKNISLRMPDLPVSIPSFRLYYYADADLSAENPLVLAKAGWKGSLNGASLKADAVYRPQKEVDFLMTVRRFNPSSFTQGQAKGNFNIDVKVQGAAENHLKTSIHVWAPWLTYSLGRERSGISRLDLLVLTDVDSPTPDFQTIDVNLKKLSINLRNAENRKYLSFLSDAKVRQSPQKTSLRFNMNELYVHPRNLVPSLPDSLQESLDPATEFVRTKVVLNGRSEVDIVGDRQTINHVTRVYVPDYEVDDIVLKASVANRPGLTQLKSITLTGLKDALSLKINGELREGMVKALHPDGDRIIKEKGTHMNVNVDLSLAQETAREIMPDNILEGALKLHAELDDNIIKGSLKINDLSYTSPDAVVSKVNLDFPFQHDTLQLETLNLSAANKEKIIHNYNYSEPFNFTIDSVQIAHPFEEGKMFTLIYPQGKYKGFGAVMRYRENVFEIPALQIILLNGMITGKDIFFNLGSMKPENMEFHSMLQIKDIDLKQLINPEKAKSIKEGSLRGDIKLEVRNLAQPVENLSGYISIYKIGKQFGKQGLKVVKPDSNAIIDWGVDNSIVVKKIDLNIREGLVYANILFSKGVVGYIVGPSGSDIVQERIPISEFMQRASQEVSVYQVQTEEEQ